MREVGCKHGVAGFCSLCGEDHLRAEREADRAAMREVVAAFESRGVDRLLKQAAAIEKLKARTG